MQTQAHIDLGNPFLIGFDHLFSHLGRYQQDQLNYPPHNIIKIDEDNFVIELAVAGFTDADLKITTKENELLVEGQKEDKREFAHKGIATRKFAKSFTLAQHVTVKKAGLENGVLSINLRRFVPEEQKAKTISIGTPQLLLESQGSDGA